MKLELSTTQAAEILYRDESASWSGAGARAMAEHLEGLEKDTGKEMEFEPAVIRCEYSEHSGLMEWARDYLGTDLIPRSAYTSDAGREDAIRDYINDRGTLIEFEGGVIVSSF